MHGDRCGCGGTVGNGSLLDALKRVHSTESAQSELERMTDEYFTCRGGETPRNREIVREWWRNQALRGCALVMPDKMRYFMFPEPDSRISHR